MEIGQKGSNGLIHRTDGRVTEQPQARHFIKLEFYCELYKTPQLAKLNLYVLFSLYYIEHFYNLTHYVMFYHPVILFTTFILLGHR